VAYNILSSVGNALGVSAGSADARFGFSLDTASWLFDFAWLAYYDPPDHARTPSSFGIMRIPHNFVVRR
jgi:hypothetical protein